MRRRLPTGAVLARRTKARMMTMTRMRTMARTRRSRGEMMKSRLSLPDPEHGFFRVGFAYLVEGSRTNLNGFEGELNLS